MNPIKWIFGTMIGWRLFLITLIIALVYFNVDTIGSVADGVLARIDHLIKYAP